MKDAYYDEYYHGEPLGKNPKFILDEYSMFYRTGQRNDIVSFKGEGSTKDGREFTFRGKVDEDNLYHADITYVVSSKLTDKEKESIKKELQLILRDPKKKYEQAICQRFEDVIQKF